MQMMKGIMWFQHTMCSMFLNVFCLGGVLVRDVDLSLIQKPIYLAFPPSPFIPPGPQAMSLMVCEESALSLAEELDTLGTWMQGRLLQGFEAGCHIQGAPVSLYQP